MIQVWTNGCYDILHIGHIRLFAYAKSLGTKLIVGIDSDKRVRELKGKSKPYNDQGIRKEFLLSIKYIDDVYVFDNEEHMCNLLLQNHISIMVIGEEYKNKKITGENIVKDIRFFPRILGFSSTNIYEKNVGYV